MELKQTMKTNVMVMCFKSLPNMHPLRLEQDENVSLIDEVTKNLYRFESIGDKSFIDMTGLKLEKTSQ